MSDLFDRISEITIERFVLQLLVYEFELYVLEVLRSSKLEFFNIPLENTDLTIYKAVTWGSSLPPFQKVCRLIILTCQYLCNLSWYFHSLIPPPTSVGQYLSTLCILSTEIREY